jgi:hypothetical protein
VLVSFEVEINFDEKTMKILKGKFMRLDGGGVVCEFRNFKIWESNTKT